MDHLKKFKILIPILLGIIVFTYYFDFTIIEPSNTAWIYNLGGDGAQQYLGGYAFRADSWHFPITKTELINYPEGVAIIYTGSNTLLSIIAKIFKGIFPPEFQIFGFWFLICWILQSLLGYLLVKKITNNFIYACLAGFLFCLLPTQIFRVFHVDLVAFWLILWTVYVFINDDISVSKKLLLFFVILSISSMVHAYFVIMNLVICMTWYIAYTWNMIKQKQYKLLYRLLAINILYGVSFIAFLWMLGYFYNNPKHANGLEGYGYYSMNLNSPFDSHDPKFSNFITPGTINDGQYEGYQYFGLGIIVMIIFVSLLNLKEYKSFSKSSIGIFIISFLLLPLIIRYNESSITTYDRISLIIFIIFYITVFYSLYKQNAQWLLLLLVPATLCFLFSLSNKIAWGTTTLIDIQINDRSLCSVFFRTFRSSGRFFWVTSQILLLLGLIVLYRNVKSAKVSIAILSTIIIIQLLDLSKLNYVIDSNNKERKLDIDSTSMKMILASKEVNFISDFNMSIGEVALLNKIPINKFYTAHGTGRITEEKLMKEDSAFKNNSLNSHNLYLFRLNNMPWNKTMEIYPAFYGNFWAIPSKDYNSDNESTIFVNRVQNDSLESIITLIQSKEIVIISSKDEASTNLSKLFSARLDQLFGTSLSNLNFRNRYIAIFKNGKLIKEEKGIDKDIELADSFNNETIQIKSGEMNSTILINNIEFSANERGLNIVSIEKTQQGKTMITTGSFDTYGNKYEYK